MLSIIVVQNGSGSQPPSFTMNNPGDSIIVELIVTNDLNVSPIQHT